MLLERIVGVDAAADAITRRVAEVLKLRKHKDTELRAAIYAAVKAEVKHIADLTRQTAMKAHIAATRRAVDEALRREARRIARPKAKPAKLPAELL